MHLIPLRQHPRMGTRTARTVGRRQREEACGNNWNRGVGGAQGVLQTRLAHAVLSIEPGVADALRRVRVERVDVDDSPARPDREARTGEIA